MCFYFKQKLLQGGEDTQPQENSLHTFSPGEISISKIIRVFTCGREVYYVRRPQSFVVFFMGTNQK